MDRSRDAAPPIDLDPVAARHAKRARERRLHTVEIPAHRAGGLLALALLVLLHNALYLEALDWPRWLALAGVLAAYALGSWLVLERCFRPLAGSRLPAVFLVADIALWLLAIYCSGGTQSLLFFLMVLRAADQAHTTFRAVLGYAHVSLLGYAALVGYLATVEQQAVSWGAEAVKIAALYAANLYMAFTTRTADGLRRRLRSAVQCARDLIRQLEIEKQRAEAASRAKSEFLANLGHEFRTPMNGVLGMTELALLSEPDAEQRGRLLTVKECAESLLRTLNTMLALSSLESGEARAADAPLALAGCARAAMARVEPQAAAKGLALRLRVDPRLPDDLLGDPEKVQGVLDHLLDNAVKFTAAGAVTVRIRRLGAETAGAPTAEPRARVALEVSDTGDGIAPRHGEAIFGPFTQADGSTTRRQGGAGLGLAVAARLVAVMGGRIGVASTPGAGSTFTVELPLRRGRPEAARSAPSRAAPASLATG